MDVTNCADRNIGVIFSGRLHSADLFRRMTEVFSKCGCTILYMEVSRNGIFLTNYNVEEWEEGTTATNYNNGNITLAVRMRKADDITDFTYHPPEWSDDGPAETVSVGITVSYALEILKNCTKSDALCISLNLDDLSCDARDANIRMYFTFCDTGGNSQFIPQYTPRSKRS